MLTKREFVADKELRAKLTKFDPKGPVSFRELADYLIGMGVWPPTDNKLNHTIELQGRKTLRELQYPRIVRDVDGFVKYENGQNLAEHPYMPFGIFGSDYGVLLGTLIFEVPVISNEDGTQTYDAKDGSPELFDDNTVKEIKDLPNRDQFHLDTVGVVKEGRMWVMSPEWLKTQFDVIPAGVLTGLELVAWGGLQVRKPKTTKPQSATPVQASEGNSSEAKRGKKKRPKKSS